MTIDELADKYVHSGKHSLSDGIRYGALYSSRRSKRLLFSSRTADYEGNEWRAIRRAIYLANDPREFEWYDFADFNDEEERDRYYVLSEKRRGSYTAIGVTGYSKAMTTMMVAMGKRK